MRKINTYIIEKFKITKDIKVSPDCEQLIEAYSKIDIQAGKVISNFIKDNNSVSFEFYLPDKAQEIEFKKTILNNDNNFFVNSEINIVSNSSFNDLKTMIFENDWTSFKNLKKYEEYSNEGLPIYMYRNKEKYPRGLFIEQGNYLCIILSNN